jgi:hypothetical protein
MAINNKKPFSWVVLHLAIIGLTLISLLTGLRIASLSHSEILFFNLLLPQGYIHDLHFYSGLSLLAILVVYVISFFASLSANNNTKNIRIFHRFVIYFGRLVLSISILTGVLIYMGLFASSLLVQVHYYSALFLLGYIILHIGAHFIQYGIKVFGVIFYPNKFIFKKDFIVLFSLVFLASGLIFLSANKSYHNLLVKLIPIETFINIDGYANERAWKDAQEIAIHTFSGANFNDGQTKVTIKAMQNSEAIFFHFSWEDPTESLQHLPLIKTKNGWKIIEKGFNHFNEKLHYEDKFALMISTNCELGASKTAHLGPKPLHDKPPNWHGKGYHYAQDATLRDLWHWKAVRTNNMKLADDNFISKPDFVRSGLRRYSAGYQVDSKDSGSYDANWQWYSPQGIIPKLLPRNPSELDIYKKDIGKNSNINWYIPWFDYQIYNAKKDNYPIGTLMPSVLYTSNRFEGDRANVRAYATWDQGVWSLEISRNLNTNSPHDVKFSDGVCIWVAAFDHAQVEHTRHVMPIRLHFSEPNND